MNLCEFGCFKEPEFGCLAHPCVYISHKHIPKGVNKELELDHAGLRVLLDHPKSPKLSYKNQEEYCSILTHVGSTFTPKSLKAT